MDSTPNEPIRLSEIETQVLTRALVEAQEQAGVPSSVDADTQHLRRGDTEARRKAGNSAHIQSKDGNMVF